MEMRLKLYRAFKVQKDGNPADYCEDAWEAKESDDLLRCAVADGATESFFSGFWANLLVASYCQGDMSNGDFNGTIDELQSTWLERVEKMELPWYAEEKSRAGAFAAIIGLTVHLRSETEGKPEADPQHVPAEAPALVSIPTEADPQFNPAQVPELQSNPGEVPELQSNPREVPELQSSPGEVPEPQSSPGEVPLKMEAADFPVFVPDVFSNGTESNRPTGGRKWEAFALGDCCLFQYRKGRLLHSMPLSASTEFNSCPYLISSRQENNKDLAAMFVRHEGRWEPGDQFLLMSDAIACWLLQEEENDEAPLFALANIHNEDDFRIWISELRSTQGKNGRPLLKNDDVTIFHLSMPEDVL